MLQVIDRFCRTALLQVKNCMEMYATIVFSVGQQTDTQSSVQNIIIYGYNEQICEII